MSYETVRDVLNRAKTFHRQVGRFYHELSDRKHKERVILLLDYMSRHEENLERALEVYEDGAGKGVLDTWFKYTPIAASARDLENIEVHDDMSVEEVIALGVRMDRCLMDLYRGMAESSVPARVRSLFQDLVALEQREDRQLARNALEMEDT
jgi:hypothetical protein